MHVQNNVVLKSLTPQPVLKESGRHERDDQVITKKATDKKGKSTMKLKGLVGKGSIVRTYKDFLNVGYSHEDCMESMGLDIGLPNLWEANLLSSTEEATSIPNSITMEPVFTDISYSKVLEASNALKEFIDQQNVNATILLKANEKLIVEVEELKESNVELYKEGQQEWTNVLKTKLNLLASINATLEVDNRVLLNWVTTCNDVEKKIWQCTNDELEIDGWYLRVEDVEHMKMELRKQGEQIWVELDLEKTPKGSNLALLVENISTFVAGGDFDQEGNLFGTNGAGDVPNEKQTDCNHESNLQVLSRVADEAEDMNNKEVEQSLDNLTHDVITKDGPEDLQKEFDTGGTILDDNKEDSSRDKWVWVSKNFLFGSNECSKWKGPIL
ncbi:hypothetical protein GOP47_0002441 [Adiantum capillus-veneris]|uniref:Uncharacterized protein n=1 Tax=Adiantum capillus-veneris TaxID=13818 RepID=A0A9D4VBR6_ADICA|nr:hypothetical protein GOP47_0002441 [Adiantum capillus-veneris]